MDFRTSNLTIRNSARQVNLKPGEKITLKGNGKINSADEPWVAVIIQDNDLTKRKELMGSRLGSNTKEVISYPAARSDW